MFPRSTEPEGPSLAAADDQYLHVDGARLRFRDEGRGPAVVFVHGWTLDLEMWQPQCAALAAYFRVIRLDRRGFGLSVGGPSLARDADDIRALCRHLGIERVALVGMSQGARSTLQLSAETPALVSCLVLDGPPDLDAQQEESGDDGSTLGEYRALAHAQGMAAFRNSWSKNPLVQLRTADRDAHDLLRRIIARYPGADLTDEAGMPRARSSDPRTALRGKPVLLISGQFDLANRMRAADALAEDLPLAERALIQGAGHLPNLDNPQQYNSLLRSFLERHATAVAAFPQQE